MWYVKNRLKSDDLQVCWKPQQTGQKKNWGISKNRSAASLLILLFTLLQLLLNSRCRPWRFGKDFTIPRKWLRTTWEVKKMRRSVTKDIKSFKLMRKNAKPLSKPMKAKSLNHALTLTLFWNAELSLTQPIYPCIKFCMYENLSWCFNV